MGHLAKVVIAVLIVLLSLITGASELLAATGHSITTWRGNHPAAVTLTFDDNYLTQRTFALPALNARGFRSTLFVITGWAQWDWYVEAANAGHEIGAHTISHPYLTKLSAADAEKEIAASQAAINTQVPNQKCLTFAYPYGDVNPLVEGLVMKYYIGARGADISNDLYNETSYDVSIRTVADLEKLTDEAVSQGTWLIPMFHSFDPAEYGKWTPEMFLSYMDYLHDRTDLLWVAPFGEVIKYIRERSAATISAASTSTAITVKLTHDLDSTVFNYPLTLRSVVPAQWGGVDVQQGGKTTTVPAVADQGQWVVYYDAVPNGGDITLSAAAAPPVALGALSLSPSRVTGGAASQGTVTLTGAAPSGGVTVTLQSDSPAAGVPDSVTVPAGESSHSFAITTTAVSAATTVTISAVYGSVTRTARLTVIAPGSAGVSITAPADGTSYLAPATVSISANATAAIGAVVSKVEFFAGTNPVGTATAAPYSVTWNDVAAGSYSLTARSTDSKGGTETSVPVSISVANGAAIPVPWATQDVGAVGLAGSATFRDGAFSLKGAGSDIWGTVDAFRFVYQPLLGDGQITVRVASLQSSNGFAKGGVMLRESLAANSAQAMMVLTPSNGARFGSRAATGGAIDFSSLTGVAPPYWVKLARSANTFTGYVSKDGVNWVQVASSTIPMPASLYAGLVLSSHDVTALASSTMDGVGVTGASPAAPAVTITVPTSGSSYYNAPAAIPITATATGGTGATVGRVDFYAGSTLVGTATSGPYSATWGSAAAGSYSLTAVVTDSLGRTGTSSPVTISVGSSAPPSVAITAPANGASYQAPATIPIGATATAGNGSSVSRVEFYAGATLIGTASASPYAVTWSNVPAGSYSLTAKVTDSGGSSATSAPVSISVAGAGLPAPWATQDLGNPLPGSASFADGTFSLQGAGSDIYGAADQFRFVYQQLNGDGQMVARVVSQQSTNEFAKAGIMIRESLADNASDAMMLLTPVNGARFGGRATTGGTTNLIPLAGVAAPYWVKLVRSGSKFSGYISPDGTNWQPAGSSSITMADTVYIGLAVTSHDATKLSLATFDSVTLGGAAAVSGVSITAPASGASFSAPATIAISATASAGSGATVSRVEFYAGATLIGSASAAPYAVTWSEVPAGSYSLTAKVVDSLGSSATSPPVSVTVDSTGLPAPWGTQDVGRNVKPGSAGFAEGTFSVQGAGWDIYGGADGFRYLYRQLDGDGEIVARVASLQNTNEFAKAGVMIRESLAENAKDAMMLLTALKGARFGRRATTGGTTAFIPLDTVAAPYWVKLVRSGSKFTGFVSANGTEWQQVGSGSISMASSVYVGLAVSSHDAATLCLATFDGVTVSPASAASSTAFTGASPGAPVADISSSGSSSVP